VEEFAQKDCSITLDTTCLADVFELTRSRVRTVREKAQRKQRPPRHPLALSHEQELQLCEMIREKKITGNYATKRELLNSVEANFLQAEPMVGFVASWSVDPTSSKNNFGPGELPRLQVPRQYLNQYIGLMALSRIGFPLSLPN
jgi:hypothetical protein